jgi:uncharacterized Zn-binding protein involved in type VI secretion
MPAVIRAGDTHIGHASPTPNGFHKTPYKSSANVYANGSPIVTIGDSTGCGDTAVGGSATVKVNNKGVHRTGDSTSGHGSWVPNAASTGSPNVTAGG